jgi:hypothetical protein
LEDNNGKIYYLNNKVGDEGAIFPSLSLPYPVYTAGNDYSMDSLVSFGGNQYYAEKNISSASTNPNQANSGWAAIAETAFLTGKNRMKVLSSNYLFEFPAADMTMNFTIADENNKTVLNKDVSSKDSLAHNLVLAHLKPGKHHFTITDKVAATTFDEFDFYYYPESGNRLFGIVEIFVHAGSGSYDVLDNNGEIKEDFKYQINFKNRHTIWRYLSAKDSSFLFNTPEPKPLSHRGFVKVVNNGEDMPNPNVNMVKPESSSIVSEIFINT